MLNRKIKIYPDVGRVRTSHRELWHQVVWQATPFGVAILFFAVFTLVIGSRINAYTVTPRDPKMVAQEQSHNVLPDLDSSEAKVQLVPFIAQDSYLTEHSGSSNWSDSVYTSRDQVRTWLKAFQADDSDPTHMQAVMALNEAPPSVVSTLIDLLSDDDPTIRQGAARMLGTHHAVEAQDALFFATFDSNADVRATSAWALGELNALFTLPRLERMQATETESNVREAANAAEEKINTSVAVALGVSPTDLRAIAIAPSNGRTYAATTTGLYGPEGMGWTLISHLPDQATALATIGDGQTIYLGTESQGPFRSRNGGRTWESISKNIAVDSPYSVTALAVRPDNLNQVYMTLGIHQGTSFAPLTPFGFFYTSDSGEHWLPVVKWNVDYVTTRLVIDPADPQFLYGLTEQGAWQFPLP